MRGSLQPDGRSPKQASGLTSASQIKPVFENFENSGNSFTSQVKGKKRERGDHCADPAKRECFSRTDDVDSAQCKAASRLKPDISRITQKGGLVDFEGVEKLVQLMQPEKVERKIDLISRSMLAGVVAATEKVECLKQFVQLKGLLVFDEWIQDIQWGRVRSYKWKDGDKSVDDFLLVLLRALDKLPVNLTALQNCNIGRSVNHLRSHKNVEIQRKARSLVDMWKKRVRVEMANIDADTGSAEGASVWSSKSHHQDSSHGGGRTLCGFDPALKRSTTQHSSSKTTSLKSSHGESHTKSASSSLGPTKPVSLPSSSSPAVITSDIPLIREDRSSSCNQSHSFNQSILEKEGRSSTLVSAASSKTSSSSSRYRKVSSLPVVIGGQKEDSSGRSFSAPISRSSDKLIPSTLHSEKDLEGPTVEANNHKLIVKISNRVRSPAPGADGASHNESSIMSSLASPLVVSDQLDNNSEEKSDAHQCNVTSDMYLDSCQISDRKDITSGACDGSGSPAIHHDEEKSLSTEDSRSTEGSLKNQLGCVKLHDTSFCPMNALIESCVKYSEAHSSLSPEDEVGMNLLASVAAGEMSKSEFVYPTSSTERSAPAAEEVCVAHDEAKSKPSPGGFASDSEGGIKKQVLFSSDAEVDVKKHVVSSKTFDSVTEEKADVLSHSGGKLVVEVASLNPASNIECKSNVNQGLDMGTDSAHKFTTVVKSELSEANKENLQNRAPWRKLMLEDGDKVRFSEIDYMNTNSRSCEVERDNPNSMVGRNKALVGHGIAASCSNTDGLKNLNTDAKVENNESAKHISLSKSGFPVLVDREGPGNDESRGLKTSEVKLDEAKCDSTVADVKMKFDLNEGFTIDGGNYGEPAGVIASGSTTVQMTNGLQFSLYPLSTPLPGSVTVAAAAKGPFLPPDDLLRSTGELGWKGSAATSAFRPAEPRKVVEVLSPATSMRYDTCTSKTGRAMLDIDLNIDLNSPDERVLKEIASRDYTLSVGPTTDLLNNHAMLLNGSSGPMQDFDLNRVDESNETRPCSTINKCNGAGSMVQLTPLGCLPMMTDFQRGFDLNDRPGVDDGAAEHMTIRQQAKVGIPSQLPFFGPRPYTSGLGSYSSWFGPGSTYSTVAIPSVVPDRADLQFPAIPPGAPQRTFGPAGITPFSPDIYRGSVLSSSPAVSFPSSAFQFSMFPFGPAYPLQSANFPIGATSNADSSFGARVYSPINSQMLGPVGAISSQLQRSYMVSLPDSSTNSGLENSRKWGRQGLDLNAGPGFIEGEVKEGLFPMSSSQHSVGSSQLLAVEQSRLYPSSGNILKRTEPEEGLDRDSFRYRQSWQ